MPVEKLKSGKDKMMGFFVGQIMKMSKVKRQSQSGAGECAYSQKNEIKIIFRK